MMDNDLLYLLQAPTRVAPLSRQIMVDLSDFDWPFCIRFVQQYEEQQEKTLLKILFYSTPREYQFCFLSRLEGD